MDAEQEHPMIEEAVAAVKARSKDITASPGRHEIPEFGALRGTQPTARKNFRPSFDRFWKIWSEVRALERSATPSNPIGNGNEA